MTSVLGKNVILLILVDGAYVPLICAETVSGDFTAELLPSSTKGDGYSKTFVYQSKSATLSFSGVVTMDAPYGVEWWSMLDLQNNFLPADVAVSFESEGILKYIKCRVLLPSISFSAGADGFATQTIAMQVSGNYTIETFETCGAAITGHTIISQDESGAVIQFDVMPATTEIVFSGILFPPLPIQAPFIASFTFPIPAVYEIVCTPYCANGTFGDPYTFGIPIGIGNYIIDSDETYVVDSDGTFIEWVEESAPAMVDFEQTDFEQTDFN